VIFGVREPAWLLSLVLSCIVLLGWSPATDRLTWLLDSLPVLIGVIIFSVSHSRWPLTLLTYRLLVLIAVLILFGARYGFAHVPLFDWLRDECEQTRNNFDRLAHFVQGFVPAMLFREILIRYSPLQAGRGLFFLVTAVTLAMSAFYELIEWWVSLVSRDGAVDFLGSQGDPWDTQWDMLLALLGALLAQLSLAQAQDRALSRLGVE